VSDSDEQEWARAVAGDGGAFGRIFDRHRDRVRRHAYGLAPTYSDADDVVSITFFEAWRKRSSIRFVDQSMLPWLLKTATYTCMNLARSEKRHRAALNRLPVSEPPTDPADSTQRLTVFAAMRGLSLVDKEIITLCVIEDLSAEDAARVLGIRPASARSRLSRARARLKNDLHESRPLLFRPEGVSDAQ